MQIFVKTLTDRTLAVQCKEDQTVGEIKQNVADREGYPLEGQSLVFGGKYLLDDETLAAHSIVKENTLSLVAGLAGGAKKRKKKVYTKPKRVPHKKKKVPLHVLKFYKVDGTGKIDRLRRECTNEDCGAGTFMAAHHDRQYCGRCGLTYFYNQNEK